MAALIYLFNPIGSARPFEDGDHDNIQACLSDVKQVMLALLAYADDHHGRLPPSQDLRRVVRAFYAGAGPRRELLMCGAPGKAGRASHVMVRRWSGARLSDIPDQASAILVYDALDGRPAFRRPPGGGTRFAEWWNARAKPGITIGYLDGHAAWRTNVTAKMIEQGRDTSLVRGEDGR